MVEIRQATEKEVNPDFIGMTEFIRRSGLSRNTIKKYIESGEITGKKLGGKYLIHKENLNIPQNKFNQVW